MCLYLFFFAGWVQENHETFPQERPQTLNHSLFVEEGLGWVVVLRLGNRDQSIQSALDYLFQQERGVNL